MFEMQSGLQINIEWRDSHVRNVPMRKLLYLDQRDAVLTSRRQLEGLQLEIYACFHLGFLPLYPQRLLQQILEGKLP